MKIETKEQRRIAFLKSQGAKLETIEKSHPEAN